jgi:hypothetical protein
MASGGGASMLSRWQFATLSGVAAATLVLAVANIVLFATNRTVQANVQARQQFIQEGVQVEPLYQQLVRSLAELSARNNDAQLKAMLAGQGITFEVAAPDAAARQ